MTKMSTTVGMNSMNNSSTEEQIHNVIKKGSLPIEISYDGTVYFKMIHRLSYFDNLATLILRNNECNYNFIYNGKILSKRFTIGVAYDLSSPENLPWTITLTKEKGKRFDYVKHHIMSMKHAEYLQVGNIQKFTNLSKYQHKKLEHVIKCSLWNDPSLDTFISSNNQFTPCRFHFKDGKTKVALMKKDDKIFGICQGILIPKLKVGSLTLFKSIDNWIHVVYPNAMLKMDDNNSNIIDIILRPVANTPLLKPSTSTLRISDTSRVKDVTNYIKTQIKDHKEFYLYYESLFLMEPEEHLYNYLINTVKNNSKIIIYYSAQEAWI